MDTLEKLASSVINGEKSLAQKLAKQALNENINVQEIVKTVSQSMQKVGERFSIEDDNNPEKFYLPDLFAATDAMKAVMRILKPLLNGENTKSLGIIVIGTVKDDMHDTGKNLVAMVLEGTGFQVIDLKVDVSTQNFVKAVKKYHPQILGMSALLTTTMENMKEVLKALGKAGLRKKVKVIIGGAPVTKTYADKIGADGYAPDAFSAVEKIKELLNIKKK